MHEVITIFTDTPLEEMMEHLPPLKCPVETIEIKNKEGEVVRVLTTDDTAPELSRERLVHGDVCLVRYNHGLKPHGIKGNVDYFNGDLNSLLGTNSERWNSYLNAGERHSAYDLLLLIFVYWYLANGGKNIALYFQFDMPLLGPETPVSKVDISNKEPGQTPMIREMMPDVMYLFFDSTGSAKNHDTGILERFAKDGDYDSFFSSWKVPKEPLTLRELRRDCGNTVAFTAVYDYHKAVAVLNEVGENVFERDKKAHQKYVEPLEVITKLPKYWEKYAEINYGTWTGPPRTKGPSKYDDCLVRMYALHCYNNEASLFELDKMCIKNDIIDMDDIGLAVLVDLENKE